MKPIKTVFIVLTALLGLMFCFLLSLAVGARSVTLQQVFSVFKNMEDDSFIALVVKERIPRTVFSMIAGASLGISGALMQSVTRNPIADPGILGVNTGASLAVVCGIAFFQIQTAGQYIWFALAGAGLTAILVYGIGSMGQGGATPLKLALAGAAVSASLSSVISTIMLPRSTVMNDFRFWQVGSVSGATWEGISTILPFLLVGWVLTFLLAPSLNTLALGEEAAIGLGVNTGRVRMAGALAGVLLCGAVTALAGPIGFVGLMIPHAIRLLFGANAIRVILMSSLGGAMLLTLADVIGRAVGRPGELEAGIVTAFLGAPVLIVIARRAKVKSI